MPISRSQIAKELEPGLHALFGIEYKRYEREYEQIFGSREELQRFVDHLMVVADEVWPT